LKGVGRRKEALLGEREEEGGVLSFAGEKTVKCHFLCSTNDGERWGEEGSLQSSVEFTLERRTTGALEGWGTVRGWKPGRKKNTRTSLLLLTKGEESTEDLSSTRRRWIYLELCEGKRKKTKLVFPFMVFGWAASIFLFSDGKGEEEKRKRGKLFYTLFQTGSGKGRRGCRKETWEERGEKREIYLKLEEVREEEI